MMNRELPTLDGRVSLSFANSIWGEQKMRDSFVTILSGSFDAQHIEASPSGQNGMELINN